MHVSKERGYARQKEKRPPGCPDSAMEEGSWCVNSHFAMTLALMVTAPNPRVLGLCKLRVGQQEVCVSEQNIRENGGRPEGRGHRRGTNRQTMFPTSGHSPAEASPSLF